MIRERIADDIYIFTSERYAQVTCGAILTNDGVVLIDTLFYPDETRQVKAFIEERLGSRVTHVINTHYHADHTMGNFIFPGARIVGHARCAELLDAHGRQGVQDLRDQLPEFQGAAVVLPHILLHEPSTTLSVGGKRFLINHLPGHSPDMLNIFVPSERVWFAADNMMPVPTWFDGSFDALRHALAYTAELDAECVVQGHGEVVLRGEIARTVEENLAYLAAAHEAVQQIAAHTGSADQIAHITPESCGKSRLLLDGAAADLHQANLHALFNQIMERV